MAKALHKIKPFVPDYPDYPLYVIDIGHDRDLSFNNRELSELKDMLSSIYAESADENESIVDTSIIALTGILTGDKNLYFSAVESEGGKQKVCKALEERDKRLLAKKDAEIAEKDAKIEQKDAEIAELKKQLAAAIK